MKPPTRSAVPAAAAVAALALAGTGAALFGSPGHSLDEGKVAGAGHAFAHELDRAHGSETGGPVAPADIAEPGLRPTTRIGSRLPDHVSAAKGDDFVSYFPPRDDLVHQIALERAGPNATAAEVDAAADYTSRIR
jgi:hypothetical protein